MRRALVLVGSIAVSLAVSLVWTERGLAHDPPRGTGVFRNGAQLLIRTNRGLVVRDGASDDFRLLCNEALGINVSEVPSLVPLPDGRWLVGTSVGLQLWDADFCSFETVEPLEATAVTALADDPRNPARIYASTGQGDTDNGLYFSENAGETFDVYSDRARDRIFEHLDVSFAAPGVHYVSGLRLNDAMNGFVHFFGVSFDEGRTFELSPFALEDVEYGVQLFAGDLAVETRVYGVAHADLGSEASDRFLVSADNGTTFTTTLEAPRLYGFAQALAELDVFVGSTAGIFRSVDSGMTFTRASDAPAYCLAHDESGLWVCDEAEGVGGVALSSDSGATLSRVMAFTDVMNPVACDPESRVASVCAAPWADWRRELLTGFAVDAGASNDDAGVQADAGSEPGSSGGVHVPGLGGGASAVREDDGGCSCSAGGARRPRSPSAFVAVLGMAWLCFSRGHRRRAHRDRRPRELSAHTHGEAR